MILMIQDEPESKRRKIRSQRESTNENDRGNKSDAISSCNKHKKNNNENVFNNNINENIIDVMYCTVFCSTKLTLSFQHFIFSQSTRYELYCRTNFRSSRIPKSDNREQNRKSAKTEVIFLATTTQC